MNNFILLNEKKYQHLHKCGHAYKVYNFLASDQLIISKKLKTRKWKTQHEKSRKTAKEVIERIYHQFSVNIYVQLLTSRPIEPYKQQKVVIQI